MKHVGSFNMRSKSQSPLSPRTGSPLSKSFPSNILHTSFDRTKTNNNNEKHNNPTMVFTFPHQSGGPNMRLNNNGNNTQFSSSLGTPNTPGSLITSPLMGRGKYL